MCKYKKFSLVFVGLTILFFLSNIIGWHFIVGRSFVPVAGHGELYRMGCLQPVPSSLEPISYEKKHTEFADYLQQGATGQFDVLTIGDSFSNGDGGNYYQDELESQYGLSVLNVFIYGMNAVSTYYALEQLGYIDKIQPKIIILESVERHVQGRYGVTLLSRPYLTDDALAEMVKKSAPNDPLGHKQLAPGIMVKANWNYLQNKIRYANHPYRISDTTNRVPLNQNLFSTAGHEKELLFLNEDLQYLDKPAQVTTINDNLNQAATDMRARGIKMVFFVAPDKLDLYYPFLADSLQEQWPENPFFDQMTQMPKQYIFMDTKKLLRKPLESGEQDIYWYDDAHWTWNAQKLFCAELMREVDGVVPTFRPS